MDEHMYMYTNAFGCIVNTLNLKPKIDKIQNKSNFIFFLQDLEQGLKITYKAFFKDGRFLNRKIKKLFLNRKRVKQMSYKLTISICLRRKQNTAAK